MQAISTRAVRHSRGKASGAVQTSAVAAIGLHASVRLRSTTEAVVQGAEGAAAGEGRRAVLRNEQRTIRQRR